MDLSLADFVLFVLLGTAGLIVILAVGSRTLHNRTEYQSLVKRVICRLCLYAFETRETGKTVDCPHCGACNERGRSRKFG